MNGLCLCQDIQMATRHIDRHPASPIIREMQTKTTIRCHLTAVEMAKINNTRNNRCWWGYGEGGAPLYSSWAWDQVQLLCKTVWRVPQEVKSRSTLWFQNCTARYLSRGYKSSLLDSKRDTQPSVCSSIINKSQTVDTAQMSIDRWMGRDDVVNIHTVTSLGHHKGWNEAIYNDMGEVEGTYAKWTQSARERQISNTIQLHSQVNFKKPNKLARGLMGWDERSKPRNSLLTTENKLIDTEEGGGDGESGYGDSGGHLWPVPGIASKGWISMW